MKFEILKTCLGEFITRYEDEYGFINYSRRRYTNLESAKKYLDKVIERSELRKQKPPEIVYSIET